MLENLHIVLPSQHEKAFTFNLLRVLISLLPYGHEAVSLVEFSYPVSIACQVEFA